MSRDAWIAIGIVVAIVAVVTLIWAVRLVFRLVSMRRMLGALGAKGNVVFWGALAYTIFPIDLLPDPIYLDDVAVLTGALFYLTRLLKKKETLAGAIPHMRKIGNMRARQRQS